jgi:hypothetical protein
MLRLLLAALLVLFFALTISAEASRVLKVDLVCDSTLKILQYVPVMDYPSKSVNQGNLHVFYLDEENNVVQVLTLALDCNKTNRYFLPLRDDAIKIKFDAGELSTVLKLSLLCNRNKRCDPHENHVGCPFDCPRASKDGYCVSALNDGACDPDCVLNEFDKDCEAKPMPPQKTTQGINRVWIFAGAFLLGIIFILLAIIIRRKYWFYFLKV